MTNLAVRPVVRDILERSIFGFIGAYLVAAGVVRATPGPDSPHWYVPVGIGLFAALLAALTTFLGHVVGVHFDNPYVDLVWRVVMQFLQTLVATMATAGASDAFTYRWQVALKIAIYAAGTSLYKALIGFGRPNTLGASVFVHYRYDRASNTYRPTSHRTA